MCTTLGIVSRTNKNITYYYIYNSIATYIFIYLLIKETTTPIECPVNYPFVFKQGRNCCKTNKEDTATGQGFTCNGFFRHPHCDSTCDGGPLSMYSNCCENGAFLRCPEGKLCIDGNENKGTSLNMILPNIRVIKTRKNTKFVITYRDIYRH